MLAVIEGEPNTGKTGFFIDVSDKYKILYVSLEGKSVIKALKKKHKVITRETYNEVIDVIRSVDLEDKDYDVVVIDPVSKMNLLLNNELEEEGVKFGKEATHSARMASLSMVANQCSKPVIFVNHFYLDAKGKQVSFATGDYGKVGGLISDSDWVFTTEAVRYNSKDIEDDRFLHCNKGKGRLPFGERIEGDVYQISGASKETANEEAGITADSVIQALVDYCEE